MSSVVYSNLLLFRSLLSVEKEIRRNLSFRQLKSAYQKYWQPVLVTPPYVHTCQVGDPVLRARASPVDPELIATPNFQKLLEHLANVMRKYGAVGLSAPQIGVSWQIFVAEMTEKQLKDYDKDTIKIRGMEVFPLKVFINPTLKVQDYSVLKFPESCESIRGFVAEVPRARAVIISGLDASGNPSTWEAKGWPARIAQHEMDHLRGTLFTDKMDTASFACSAWQEINKSQGRIELRYYK